MGATGAQEAGDAAIILFEQKKDQLNDVTTMDPTDDFTNTETFFDNLKTAFDTLVVPDPIDGSSVPLDIFEKTAEDEDNNPAYPFYAALHKEMETFKTTVVQNLQNLKGGIEELNEPETLNNARGGLNDVGEVVEQINDFKGDFYDYVDTGRTVFNGFQIGMIVYYAIMIFSTVAIIVGSILSILHGSKWWRFLTNFGCVFMGILMTLGFLLTGILLPLSVALIEACDLIKQENLEKDRGLFPEEVWEHVDLCFTGDGNMYRAKDLETKLSFASDSADGLNDTATYYDSDSNKMKYPVLEQQLEYYQNMYDKPYLALDKLKDGTIKIMSTSNDDEIVWSECKKFKDGLELSAAEFVTTASLCLPILRCESSHVIQINNRYVSNPNLLAEIQGYIAFAGEARDAIKNLIELLDNASPPLDPTTNSYRGSMDEDTKTNEMLGVMEAITKAGDLDKMNIQMRELKDGLREGLNCVYMQDSFGRVQETLCGDLIQRTVFTAVLLGVISCLSVVLSTIMVCSHRCFFQLSSNNKFAEVTPAPTSTVEPMKGSTDSVRNN